MPNRKLHGEDMLTDAGRAEWASRNAQASALATSPYKKDLDMKFLSSLKAWKKRGNIKQIRRGKQVILIDPDNPKLKAKQGFKKK